MNPNYAASNVVAYRRITGMSRAGLLRRLETKHSIKLHQSSLKRIEDGTQTLKLDEAAALADIFGVTLDEFTLHPADEDRTALGGAVTQANETIGDLWEALRYTTQELQEQIQSAIDTYGNKPTTMNETERAKKTLSELDASMDALLEAFHVLGKETGWDILA
ncbi:MAG TPA: helix-turn-helix domain-containing protein [Candidatus Corynebacterium gallistercoris]|uniref:Helix-turn-helix domain-containing protein n=1 Tax=Candidatus Corynebacterium gallistercoris TaxID=2838530 RepID=A0A9D1UQF0_9CORY|nr:helix-turn-helix domain-containing protein [Candidatus Corynebacterium gallistercoris]